MIPDLADEYGWLADEPFYLTPGQVLRLTDAQIEFWYRPARDAKTGARKAGPGLPAGWTVEDLAAVKAKYLAIGAALGKSPEELEAHWAESFRKAGREVPA